jgi:hypothetical protein
MANDVTVNINAETNVPEAADKSKKAMSSMENAVNGINKKMENFGKDLILSYIAPMVLLNKAIDYVANRIEENRRLAKEALDFAAKGESKKLDIGTVSGARDIVNRAKEIEEEAQAIKAREVVAEDFLRNASEKDLERFYKRLGPGSRLMLGMASYEGAAADKSVQDAIMSIKTVDTLRAEEERNKAMKGGTGPGGVDSMAVQNAVFGMGTSPIIASMDQQLEVQRQQADTLRRIEDRLPPREEDYTKGESGTPYRPTINFR